MGITTTSNSNISHILIVNITLIMSINKQLILIYCYHCIPGFLNACFLLWFVLFMICNVNMGCLCMFVDIVLYHILINKLQRSLFFLSFFLHKIPLNKSLQKSWRVKNNNNSCRIHSLFYSEICVILFIHTLLTMRVVLHLMYFQF